MNNTNEIIDNLISYSMFNKSNGRLNKDWIKEPVTMVDWEELKTELNNQTICAIPLEFMINNLKMESAVNNDMTIAAFGQVGAWTKLMEAQQSLVNIFTKKNIDLAIIKGIVAGANYPKPEYRAMGDVDFFVRPNDFENAFEIMLDNGYALPEGEYIASQELTSDKYHHVEFIKDGIIFELHKHMADVGSSKEYNKKFQDLINSNYESIQVWAMDANNPKDYKSISYREYSEMLEEGKVDIGVYYIPVFPKKINGIIFIRHIVQHMLDGKGIGLRHIMDWMMFVNKYVDDEYWRSEFEETMESFGLKDVAVVITRMCQLYLGLPKTITWCNKADEELCYDVLEMVMSAGNFGRKNAKENEGANVLYKNKNIFTFFGSLQTLGIRNWNAAKRHAVLRPFAWLYQICRYIRKGLFRKSPIKSLRQDISKSKGKRDVVERLNIR